MVKLYLNRNDLRDTVELGLYTLNDGGEYGYSKVKHGAPPRNLTAQFSPSHSKLVLKRQFPLSMSDSAPVVQEMYSPERAPCPSQSRSGGTLKRHGAMSGGYTESEVRLATSH